jgi:hypothetical protein
MIYVWPAYTESVIVIERRKEQQLPSFLEIVQESQQNSTLVGDDSALRQLYFDKIGKHPHEKQVISIVKLV